MDFYDTAVFALVMILGGLLLSAAVIALGVIVSFFFAGTRRSEGDIGGE